MQEMPEGSVGTIVCDPPYLIDFMGEKWDGVPQGQMHAWHLRWLTAAYKVLRPGGTIKAFSGTRTQHLLAAAMVEAGFVLQPTEAWVYGSGFPKSHNIEKALTKLGETDAATLYAGYGTALKPAWEPVLVGQKPG